MILKNFKNKIDFFLRQSLNFPMEISESKASHILASQHQSELAEFLYLFDWPKHLSLIKSAGENLRVADIGTRTFCIAPVLDELFRRHNLTPTVHGIEIDAHRRFSNFHSRADYGRFYARKILDGHFHPIDFLKFNQSLDIVLMLHPFVTIQPLLNWGLPKKELKPDKLFCHAFDLIKKPGGLFLLSSPNDVEFELACSLAENSGFVLLEEKNWIPDINATQKKPRIGALFKVLDAPLGRSTEGAKV